MTVKPPRAAPPTPGGVAELAEALFGGGVAHFAAESIRSGREARQNDALELIALSLYLQHGFVGIEGSAQAREDKDHADKVRERLRVIAERLCSVAAPRATPLETR